MKQKIQQVVRGGVGSVERAIQQKGRIQHGTDHVIKMAEKSLPVIEMSIPEER